MKSRAQISCDTPEHYLPLEYVKAAVYTLGGVDTDPATSELANAAVGAKLFYTIDNPGEDAHWHGRVLCNAPGDSRGRLVPIFWGRCSHHALTGAGPVLWVGYSLEQLRRLSDVTHGHPDGKRWPSPLDWHLAVPRKRLRWRTPYCRLKVSGRPRPGNLEVTIDGRQARIEVQDGMSIAELGERVAVSIEALDCIEGVELDVSEKAFKIMARHATTCEYEVKVIEKPAGIKATLNRNESPPHGNYFALLGADDATVARFREAFGKLRCEVKAPRHGRRGAPRCIQTEVLRALASGPMRARELRRAVRARNAVVLDALKRLEADGRILRNGHHWTFINRENLAI